MHSWGKRLLAAVLLGLAALSVTGAASSPAQAAQVPAAVSAAAPVSSNFTPAGIRPAAPEDDSPYAKERQRIQQGQFDYNVSELIDSKNLTINRWQTATSTLAQKFDGFDMTSVGGMVSRSTMQNQMMSAGNMSWSIALGFTNIGSGSDITGAMLYPIDALVANILSVFTGKGGGPNPLAIATIIAFVFTLLLTIRKFRGRDLLKRVIVMGIIAGMMWFSTAQLLGPNGPLNKSAAGYRSPAGTPGWVVTKVKSAFDGIASAGSKLAVATDPVQNRWTSPGTANYAFGCGAYLQQLERNLAGQRTATEKLGAGQNVNSAALQNFEMRSTIDRLWQMSGLQTWVNAQFGEGNQSKNDAFCYLLDQRSSDIGSSSTGTNIDRMAKKAGVDRLPVHRYVPKNSSGQPLWDQQDYRGSAILNPSDNTGTYASTIGFAACRWDGAKRQFSVAPDWGGFNNSDGRDSGGVSDALNMTGGGISGGLNAKNAAKICMDWATSVNAGKDPGGAPRKSTDGKSSRNWVKDDDKGVQVFDIRGNSYSVDYASPNDQVRDFLGSFTGTGAGGGIGTTLGFALFSGIGTLPIDIVNLMKIFAELVLAYVTVMLFVALCAALYSPEPWNEKLKPPLMQMLSAALLASGASVILGVLMLLSYALARFGQLIIGGGFFGTAWVCASPLVSFFVLAWLWRKSFKGVPSPFTLKGMGAWAKGTPLGVSAMVGGASGALASRLGGHAEQKGKSLASSLQDTALDRNKGGYDGVGSKKRRGAFIPNRERLGEVEKSDQDQKRSAAQAHEQGGPATKAERIAQTRADQRDRRQAKVELWRERHQERRTSLGGAPKKMSSALGLDAESRARMRNQLNLQGRQGVRRAGSWVSHVGAHATVSAAGAAGKLATAAPKALHNRIVANAGEGATVGEAYRRMAAQTVLVGGAAALTGGAGGVAALAAVSGANRRNRRNDRQRERDEQIKHRAGVIKQARTTQPAHEQTPPPESTKAPAQTEPTTTMSRSTEDE